MTEPTTTQEQSPELAEKEAEAARWREIREEENRKILAYQERTAMIDRAHQSPEARLIRELVLDDGNVEWREFVTHVGGILEVVKLVGQDGLPDVDRIIPKVDEIFNGHVEREIAAGSVFRRYPRNRPYVPGPDVRVSRGPVFPGDGQGPQAVEQLLAEEAEAAERRAAWNSTR